MVSACVREYSPRASASGLSPENTHNHNLWQIVICSYVPVLLENVQNMKPVQNADVSYFVKRPFLNKHIVTFWLTGTFLVDHWDFLGNVNIEAQNTV